MKRKMVIRGYDVIIDDKTGEIDVDATHKIMTQSESRELALAIGNYLRAEGMLPEPDFLIKDAQ